MKNFDSLLMNIRSFVPERRLTYCAIESHIRFLQGAFPKKMRATFTLPTLTTLTFGFFSALRFFTYVSLSRKILSMFVVWLARFAPFAK